MDICDDQEACSSDRKIKTEFISHRSSKQSSDKDASNNCKSSLNNHPITVVTTKSLDKSRLLSHFDGNGENVEYYCQLKEFLSRLDEYERGDLQLSCDPRDAKKVEQVGGWRPVSRVEDVADVVKQCEGEGGIFVSKQTAVDKGDSTAENEGNIDGTDETGKDAGAAESFGCGVHGCGETFTSLALHEAHYHRCHNYACATCRRSFVSNFLLDIHIQENHDSYFQILSSRIDMYCCLVESCGLKFRTADLRKDHVVSVHKFPANFSFHRPLKDSSPSAAKSKADNKCMKVATDMDSDSPDPKANAMETELEFSQGDGPGPGPGPTVHGGKGSRGRNTSTKSKRNSNQRVPTSVSFGQGSHRAFQRRGRGGRGNHWHQAGRPEKDTSVDIESVDMKELADSLS